VKNKNKNLAFFVFENAFLILAVFLFNFSFVGADKETSEEEILEEVDECSEFSEDIKINEIFPNPESGKKEFIEIKNFGEKCINISNWKIKDKADKKISFDSGLIIEQDEIIFVQISGSVLNNDSEIVYLFDPDNKKIDEISYSKTFKGKSYSFDKKDWFWTSFPTPGDENEFEDLDDDGDNEEEENFDYNIRINELLPNPKENESADEFVELYNSEDEEINLENWILKDSSKTEFVFSKDFSIKPKNYLVIYRKDFKFALNNSGGENIYLFNPSEDIIYSTSYEGSAGENASYGFDGTNWRWSKHLTPNKENKFSKPLCVDIKKIKTGYAKMPIKFEVKIKNKDGNKISYHWDFGDEKASYLENPTHTFEKTGKYKIILTVKNEIEEVEKSFTIEIKKYPRLEVFLSRLMPNPLGVDSGKEWIEIKNNSKKKVDLKNWKIATGVLNLANHSILSEIEIKPGETIKLTRANALFSLNNKEYIVELLYPDQKTASRVEYHRQKIGENEICQNSNGKCLWYLANASDYINQVQPASYSENEDSYCEDGNENCWEEEVEDEEDEDENENSNDTSETLKEDLNLPKLNFSEKFLELDTKNFKNKNIYEFEDNYRFTPIFKDQPH